MTFDHESFINSSHTRAHDWLLCNILALFYQNWIFTVQIDGTMMKGAFQCPLSITSVTCLEDPEHDLGDLFSP